jgi:hypothetical protein
MGDLEVVTTADRHDLDEQARDALRSVWPEFIFHYPVAAEHISRVETYFPQYDVLLLDDGQVVAGGWGVPIRWEETISTLPDGYDGALVSAVTGHENSVPADTLCIMAAAVRADRQGGGLAGKTLTALRERAAGRPWPSPKPASTSCRMRWTWSPSTVSKTAGHTRKPICGCATRRPSHAPESLGGRHASGAQGGPQPGDRADKYGRGDAACPGEGGDDDRLRLARRVDGGG